jgi:hypothetical protein
VRSAALSASACLHLPMKSWPQGLGHNLETFCFTSTVHMLNEESVWPGLAQNRTANTAALSLLVVFSISFL